MWLKHCLNLPFNLFVIAQCAYLGAFRTTVTLKPLQTQHGALCYNQRMCFQIYKGTVFNLSVMMFQHLAPPPLPLFHSFGVCMHACFCVCVYACMYVCMCACALRSLWAR